MSSVNWLCKLFGIVITPLESLLVDVIFLVFTEFLKFLTVLFLAFAIGYTIFFMWNFLSENDESRSRPTKSERLSAGLMGSFSKYPYVVELPSRTSAGSI